MELVKEFGIDPLLLVAQIVNFIVVLYILKRLLYKPILEMLQKREQTIKDGLKTAQDAQELLEKTLEREKTILKNAQLEARRLIDDAKKEANGIVIFAESSAKEQSNKILRDAQLTIDEEVKRAERVLESRISRLAIDFLEQTLKQFFTEKNQQDVLKLAQKHLKKKIN